MPMVAIRPDLLADLQAAAEGEGRTLEELADRAIEDFLRQRRAPEWHVPLVRHALDQVAEGRTSAYSRERILARANRDGS